MRLKETLNRFSFMPAGSIDVKPDRIALQSPIKMAQDFHESFPIAALRPNNPKASQKRGYPARKIKALLMLTGRRNTKRMSSFSPSPPQSRMERKSRLILEDHRFPRSQILKFFLTPGEMASHLWPALEGRHSWPALSDIPVDASTSELVALSALIRTGVSNVRPAWAHPNEPGSDQNPGEIAPNDVPLPGLSEGSSETAAQVWACFSGLLSRPHSPPESSDLGSCASAPKPGLSSPVVALRRSTGGQRLSIPSKPQEWSWPRRQGFPESPPDVGDR